MLALSIILGIVITLLIIFAKPERKPRKDDGYWHWD
jgi:hypothetical protein